MVLNLASYNEKYVRVNDQSREADVCIWNIPLAIYYMSRSKAVRNLSPTKTSKLITNCDLDHSHIKKCTVTTCDLVSDLLYRACWMWMNFKSHQCKSFVSYRPWKLLMKISNSPCMMRTDRKGSRGEEQDSKVVQCSLFNWDRKSISVSRIALHLLLAANDDVRSAAKWQKHVTQTKLCW